MKQAELLKHWVLNELSSERLEKQLVIDGCGLELSPLSGDAGFREYFRVNTQPKSLAVTAPQQSGISESAIYFARLSEVLRLHGVSTPKVYACNEENNRLLIESFGETDLLSVLSPDTVNSHYAQALQMLLILQQVPQDAVNINHYDAQLLSQEMALFPQWFIGDLLGHTLSPAEQCLLDEVSALLVEQALAQPQVFVHRDYHSRNLMCRDFGSLGVIDFQDAVWGPITYDLVSLLKDCYIRWSPEEVRRWAIAYGNMAHEIGLLPEVSAEQFLQWFDFMGLQRHIKVLGIFARLSLRDGKSRYLDDLPLVMRYVLEVAHRYPQTHAFAHWFEESLLPLAVQQPWYKDYAVAGEQS